MKRFVGATLIISAATFGLFLTNLLLYVYNPTYHNVVLSAVIGNDDIPVVEGRNKGQNISGSKSAAINELVAIEAENGEIKETSVKELDESITEVPLSASFDKDIEAVIDNCDTDVTSKEDKPAIVDKQYHEDCGSGKGYWIITYSDGSVKVE